MPRAPEPPRPGTLLRSSHAGHGDGERAPRASLALGDSDFGERPDLGGAAGDLPRRMNAWGRTVVERLRSGGLELALRETLDEDGGTRRLVFAAGDHGALELRVGASGVAAGFALPCARARAVRAELSNPERALELATALEALPEQFVAGVDGDASMQAAPRCTPDDVRALLDRAEQESRPVWIGWTVARDVAVEHSALLDEQLEDALVALVRVFALLSVGTEDAAAAPRHGHVAWSRHDPARSEDERGRTKKRAREASQRQGRDAARDRVGAREADGEGEPSAFPPANRHGGKDGGVRSSEVAAPPHAAARRRPAALSTKGPSRGGARSRSAASIERGTRVRVLEGPFSGKVGTVHELDGKGGARVMLGLLAVRFDVTNLAVHDEGRRRPVLGTSHRKPVPVRS
jgi:hypothetical protein